MENINKLQFNVSDAEPEVREQISAGIDLKLLAESRWVRITSNPVKSVFLVAIALLFVGTTTQTASAQQRGSQGSQVRYIQRCLKRLGYFNARVTGFYGSATQAAVTSFQSAVGLPRVGKVGPRTTKALNRRCGSTRRGGGLRNGSNGPAVRKLQKDLTTLGYYNGPITGNFRKLTEAAVIRFQRAKGISAIGVVGPQTKRAIREGLRNRFQPSEPGRYNPTPTGRNCNLAVEGLSVGCDGQSVTQLQIDLQRLGIYNGPVTGYFGQLTQNAVMTFQESRGLRMTGMADNNTLDAIRTELDRSGSIYQPPYDDQNSIPNTWSGGNPELILQEGDTGNRVTQLQRRLQELGFFQGKPTGYFGPLTREKVADFQNFNGLPVTGFVDRATWEKLDLGRRTDKRYVVVIPVTERDTLWKVRRFVRDAFAARSRRGDYINAGEFEEASEASRLSKELRQRGFDARVEYL